MKSAVPEFYQGHRVVSASEMAIIDHQAIHVFGIPALVLMENAGKCVAEETEQFIKVKLGRSIDKALITICCGRGNNGGDGLVAARYLKAMGAEVVAYLAQPKRDGRYTAEVSENLKRAASSGVSVQEVGEDLVALDIKMRSSDVLIDALLGTGASGKPAGAIHDMIQRMMKAGKPIIAVDIPSGIHPDTGYHSGVFITAAMTVALGLPKRGLLTAHAQRNVGELKIADIGLPEELLQKR